MSLPTAMIALAIVALLVTYISEPFRRRPSMGEDTLEAWIAQAREAHEAKPETPAPEAASAPAAEPRPSARTAAERDVVNFCPQCGRRVAEDHRFCPGCGARL